MVSHPTAGKRHALCSTISIASIASKATPPVIAPRKSLTTKKKGGRPRFAVDTPLRAFWRERQRLYYATHRESWNTYIAWRRSL